MGHFHGELTIQQFSSANHRIILSQYAFAFLEIHPHNLSFPLFFPGKYNLRIANNNYDRIEIETFSFPIHTPVVSFKIISEQV